MNEQAMDYAGFWVRVGAMLIDVVLVILVTLPLLVGIYGWAYFDPAGNPFIKGPADFLISWVFPSLAVILFWRYRQATPGKMMLSLRVVDADTGANPSLGQSVGRYLAYLASMAPLGLGLLWVAFDPRKQAWHDKLAHTVVVRSRKHGPQPVSFPRA
ncbi:RDD family protein [Rhodoferax sp.]|uniref:RDD family protein n=1 Tax=Rhodoferax sp. TaxID=50421 RepID=UPI00277750C6|nr:RDD family protein [Rhodoferax sp.]